MRQYLKDLKPTNIEDLIAMNALYRPGPMQFIPNFINRKHGREPVEYPHELLEPILHYSQGICVTGDTLVHDADTGARVRIDELAGRVGSFRVQGVDADLNPTTATATHFFDNGLRDVVRVRLRDGSSATMTPDHKVLTEAGWTEIGQLTPGDFIGTPRQLFVENEADYDWINCERWPICWPMARSRRAPAATSSRKVRPWSRPTPVAPKRLLTT